MFTILLVVLFALTRAFNLLSRGFELVTRKFEFGTRGFELATCIPVMVNRNW